MSELVEFGSLAELQTLLLAAMELKFELADDSDTLVGSPIYAAAVNQVRDALVEGFRAGSMSGKAQRTADSYQLSRYQHRWPLIVRRACGHPRWRDLSDVDRRQWIEVLAAPLVVDDEIFTYIRVAVDERVD